MRICPNRLHLDKKQRERERETRERQTERWTTQPKAHSTQRRTEKQADNQTARAGRQTDRQTDGASTDSTMGKRKRREEKSRTEHKNVAQMARRTCGRAGRGSVCLSVSLSRVCTLCNPRVVISQTKYHPRTEYNSYLTNTQHTHRDSTTQHRHRHGHTHAHTQTTQPHRHRQTDRQTHDTKQQTDNTT